MTVFDQIAWSYANLARAHAALSAGRIEYIRTDHIIRARLFSGLRSGRMSIGSLYDDERLKMLADRACAYCANTERLTMDHLIPRIRGGGDEGANLVLACGRCNSAKSGVDLLLWYERRGVFPPLMVLRRYIKLGAGYCEREALFDCALGAAELRDLPFLVQRLPVRYPPLDEMRL
ncbi:HNH endonuclease signature motif containing protein [Sphingomonas sp.]|uniref:HNH endonuclease n=1 Tax=Sphingomonas sp. TaxID=28214 RepID=UPI002C87D0EE|nr:HNH endonuclease signature motif containing protein [Sphingomonas sp.]HWK35212.1 HNH endonuclease signature motif containing protein [Sphingomonas sp.]